MNIRNDLSAATCMIAVALLLPMAACRSTPPTPDDAWNSYRTAFRATGAVAEKPVVPAAIEVVPSASVDESVRRLLEQGMVDLGTFEIGGGSEISSEEVVALAEKLDASCAIWCTVNTVNTFSEHPNAPLVTPGVDSAQLGGLVATRSDESMAEHTVRKHTIRMFGRPRKNGVAK